MGSMFMYCVIDFRFCHEMEQRKALLGVMWIISLVHVGH